MDGTCKYRTLWEGETFKAGLAEIVGFQTWDMVLSGLVWGIVTNPCQYDLVPDTQRLRIAKSHPVQFEDGTVATLRIWFAPRDNDDEVDLKAIEATPEENMFDDAEDPFGDQ